MIIIRQVTVMLLAFTVLCGAVYPGLVTGIARWWFPTQAEGSILADKQGNIVGSTLIGQQFTKPEYFWGRLSATAPVPYNAAASSGSNLSNSNALLVETVRNRIADLAKTGPTNKTPIPVDLVTASASGLDPHISIAAAEYQIERIATLRKLPEEDVRKLVAMYTEDRFIGILGEPVVNVLQLNLALDGRI